MKCIVVDDEPMALDIIEDYIKKIPFLEWVGSFRDPFKAMDFLHKQEVDLLFLDINMPDLSGMQLLKSLKVHPLVIFTTAYSEFALESYDYEAVDYLLKPVEWERFVKAVSRAQDLYDWQSSHHGSSASRDFILIKSGTKYHRLNYAEILFIAGTGNYATFVTARKEVMYLSSMKEVQRMLPPELFFRVHKSYIVNLSLIDLIEDDEIKIGTKSIPIGDLYRDEFYRQIRQK